MESVESVIRELHEGFVYHEKIVCPQCTPRLEYISHDGILELNLKCEGNCMPLQDERNTNEHAKLLERWKRRIEKIKMEADEVYIGETGISFWALFNDTSAEIEKAEA